MTKNTIKIHTSELKSLMEWISTLDDKDYIVEITASPTGIGDVVEASIQTIEGQGVWKDITNYEIW